MEQHLKVTSSYLKEGVYGRAKFLVLPRVHQLTHGGHSLVEAVDLSRDVRLLETRRLLDGAELVHPVHHRSVVTF